MKGLESETLSAQETLLLPFVHPIKKGAKLITTHTNQHIVESTSAVASSNT